MPYDGQYAITVTRPMKRCQINSRNQYTSRIVKYFIHHFSKSWRRVLVRRLSTRVTADPRVNAPEEATAGSVCARMASWAAFLRLVLHHVLSKGLRRARNFSLVHANRKRLIALLHVVLELIPRAVWAG